MAAKELYPTFWQRQSSRNLGILCGLVLALLGLLPLLRRPAPDLWLLVPSIALLTIALLRPLWLFSFVRAGSSVRRSLAKVATPAMLGLLFYGVFSPLGWIIRRSGGDLLRMKIDPDAESYWIGRLPAVSDPSALTKQY